MRLLITGGCGFIGSNFIRYMRENHPGYSLTNLDNLTYAGNLDNLAGISEDEFYSFRKGDICDTQMVDELVSRGFDAIIHFAAESHVDRSVYAPDVFVRTNIQGTLNLLASAVKYKIQRFIQISTDEVYGSLGQEGYFTEESPLAPNSPYSSSKAGADLLARAYVHTYGLPVIITRCSNNYGPYQFPEKLIPLMITNALEDKELPVYGDGLNIRDWLYVEDHCRAIDLILHRGRPGEVYNIGGNNEKTNLEIVRYILKKLGKSENLIRFVKDRPGHDRRYAIDATKIKKELAWEPLHNFEEGMEKTILWYEENKDWLARVCSGEYRLYYEKMYKNR